MYHVPWLGYGLAFMQSFWGRLLLGITVGGSLIVPLARNRGFHANARRAQA